MDVRSRRKWPIHVMSLALLFLALGTLACTPTESQITGRYAPGGDPTRDSWSIKPGGGFETVSRAPDGQFVARRGRWKYERGLLTSTLRVETETGKPQDFRIAKAGGGICIEVPEKRSIFVKFEEYSEPQTILDHVPPPR